MDSTLSIKNASGKTFSLLNDSPSNAMSARSEETSFKVTKLTTSMTLPVQPKRKYHCTEPGCNKSFTTSGHLARHNRIHTGEKNFHCLHPGCPSRFSRQDNMMQHYRTHLSQKLRRQHLRQHQQQQQQQDKKKESPQLYCHSFHGGEDHMSFQPLMTRPRRSVTMPSLPYPPANLSAMMNQQQQQQQHKVVNRPRRALSTSSTCSSSSVSSCSASPPSMMYYYDHAHSLPPPPNYYHAEPVNHHHSQPHSARYNRYQHTQRQQSQQPSDKQLEDHEWAPSSQKSLSSLLHLANIVSTFG
ncbi:hypothetical protein MAM1_0285d09240 [Mucor ambiguus]|uniref:C2H2-type domain-containing protein n=1 Tax=Mucor ambiguus TaxID=91626 RepID=A0A0C9N567_9FUNG|nr:hypothetical protein MAM1_0285d09240 [Mucor ambiguus]